MGHIPKSMLGRYEFVGGTSDKFWMIEAHGAAQYKATWGRNGTPGQGVKIYEEGEAYKKINEKIAKGYQKVDSSGRKMKTDQLEATVRMDKKREVRREENASAKEFMRLLKKV